MMMTMQEVIAGKYSQAIFDIACDQNTLEEMEQELQTVQDVFKESDDLQKVIEHPLLPADAKKNILKDLFATKVSPMVLQFLFVMVDRRREMYIEAAIIGFRKLYWKARNMIEAKIRVIAPLTEQEEAELLKKLEAMTGSTVVPHYIIDPSILGGVVIQLEDRLIDGSLKRQLQTLEDKLLRSKIGGIEVTNEI